MIIDSSFAFATVKSVLILEGSVFRQFRFSSEGFSSVLDLMVDVELDTLVYTGNNTFLLTDEQLEKVKLAGIACDEIFS